VVAPALLGHAAEVGDLDAVAGDRHDLVLAELERLAGVLDERRDVGAEEVLPVPEPDDQRRVAPGRHHPRRVVGVHRDQGERALELLADPLHRDREAEPRLELELEQLGRDLGVGLGGQGEVVGLEPGAQLGEVLDDAVVDQGHPAGVPDVGVGVHVVGRPVGGPAGVPDTRRRRRQGPVGDRLLEVGELAGLLRDRQRRVGDDGDAGRVVAAVLQPAQAVEHHVLGLPGPDVTHDPAHGRRVY
jgi:hypothetical protein